MSGRLVHDQEADASYLDLRQPGDGAVAHRTVELTGSIYVDLDADGRIIGVERCSGVLTLDDLAEVLLRVRWADEQPRSEGELISNPVTGDPLGVVVSGEGVRANKIIEERWKGDHE